MPRTPDPLRYLALIAPLRVMPHWWVRLRCAGCGTLVDYPLRLLQARYGGGWSLGEALPRLRCKRCRQPAASALLTDDPQAGPGGGSEPTWRHELLNGKE